MLFCDRDRAMRVWLVEEKRAEEPSSLEAALKQLAAQPEAGLTLQGVRPFRPDFAAELCAQMTDVVVVHEPSWPDGPWLQELLELGVAVVVITTAQRRDRFAVLTEQYPVVLAPLAAGVEWLGLALASAYAARRRHDNWKTQVLRLQQRLNDRIVIERAKGLLVQRMGISEEEAYNRLRVLSRRQRRQIRDIAQSLLDTQALFTPGNNGNPDIPFRD